MLFFFNDTATTEIYTLSLHDALPISFVARDAHRKIVGIRRGVTEHGQDFAVARVERNDRAGTRTEGLFGDELQVIVNAELNLDRKSTRLNSSHGYISYAVFCLKKKTT